MILYRGVGVRVYGFHLIRIKYVLRLLLIIFIKDGLLNILNLIMNQINRAPLQ